ncbi:MAG: RluA family pseudouridine synthase [Planctomycetales bacterium]|nr:RluA family pseudouridine synthase [Planctomycetales bacterium]
MSKSNPPSDAQVYHLSESHSGLTLAGALKQLNDGASWNDVKKWISSRRVQVNGNLSLDEARRVSASDVVKLFQRPLPRPVSQEDVRFVHIDEHLIVVEKPAGVTSVRHAAERTLSTRRRQLQPTLEELIPPALAKRLHLRWPPLPPKGMNRGKFRTNQRRRHSPNLAIQNAKKLPPELQIFPVHRLDRDTSGLMLFARTRETEQKLTSMFKRHTVQREYTAICIGDMTPQTIHTQLVRDRGDGLRGSVAGAAGETIQASAVDAITHIVSVEPVGKREPCAYSRIRCKLETGRTHQIRIHLAESGHPLCGEKTYRRQLDGTTLPDRSGAPRQALHSDCLEFTHPVTGKHLRFTMELPKDLAVWLKTLE